MIEVVNHLCFGIRPTNKQKIINIEDNIFNDLKLI